MKVVFNLLLSINNYSLMKLPGFKIFPLSKANELVELRVFTAPTDTNNENLFVVEPEITILTMIMNNNNVCEWTDSVKGNISPCIPNVFSNWF